MFYTLSYHKQYVAAVVNKVMYETVVSHARGLQQWSQSQIDNAG